MYRKGQTTGSNRANRALLARHPLVIGRSLSLPEEELLYDPQTSGGLLLALPREEVPQLLRDLHAAGVEHAVRIGEIVEGEIGITVE
jgi:selenide,water dikinase